jgi:hypothetical protein
MSDLHLTYCCPACQRVKDQRTDGSMDQEWCTMSEYVKRDPASRQNALLAEFYCTDCSTSYDRLIQYGGMNHFCFL